MLSASLQDPQDPAAVQDNQVPKVTKVMLDPQERRETQDNLESRAHLDPKDQLVLLETRDQEPRESLENTDSQAWQDPKGTQEREERLEQLEPQDQRARRVTLETKVYPECQVLLGLLEIKAPRVRLETKVPKEMKVHVPRPCA